MQIKDPKPEIMRLEELALMVKAGEIKLPKFQRPFVWNRSDMLKLLDSIYKGYPIGSILIWNSSQRLNSERTVLGLDVNVDENTSYPTNYLLDGQQRLTTLCGALFWNGSDNENVWNIQFNLETEEFLYPKDSNLVTLFPLNRLIRTSDFIKQCMKFDYHQKREEFYRISERLLKSIKDYKIAVVKIGDMTIDEVAPIFERINSTGRKLTIVDLMMAATWSNTFDLTKEISIIRNTCYKNGFEEIQDSLILRSIAASANLGINKDDIQKLRNKEPEELCQAAKDAHDALEKALIFLKNEIGVLDITYLPYGIQLTLIAEFFRTSKSPSKETLGHLSDWFWYTSITRYFTSANTGQVSKDLASIRNFASGKTKILFEPREIDISELLFDKFNLRIVSSTTFSIILQNMNPILSIDGRSINGIRPKTKSSKLFSSILPEMETVSRLNVSKIIHPFNDLNLEPQGNGPQVELGLLLINKACLELIREKKFNEFLNERSKVIADRIFELTKCKAIYKLDNSAIDSEEVESEIDEEKK